MTTSTTSNPQFSFKKSIDKLVENATQHIGPDNINLLNKHKFHIFGAVLITILFILISKWAYYTYVEPVLNRDYLPNKEFISKDSGTSNEIDIYYFYTKWCPYCKKAESEWNEFQKNIESNNIYTSNYNINFYQIDADKEVDLAKKYKISAYPTIKLVKNGKTYNYEAKPDSQNLMEFFKGSL